ncbi:RHS repeat-associated core domain-containing protein [Pseudomonas putida]|uniref:RHS repeat-associated core domain-containing protein n=1 Tax=Pseudomonas putida TaxID=303 RepID=UPI001F51CE30|nr:RHS repeat-associated core domain-containing protein [Pseudomonas putida]MCI0913676.1 RHS repeat-associated core domain-containing protein [Pseudomonas putida]
MATNTEKEVSSPDSPAESRGTALEGKVMHFYQNDHLATELSENATRSILWSDDIALAQLDKSKACALLEVDQANSVLGMRSETMAYSPYGHGEPGHADALLAFNGQRRHLDIEAYLLGNGTRMYRPALLRFSSPDIYSPFDEGGLNIYAYCKGDPINNIDPSGNIPRFIRSVFKGFRNIFRQRTPQTKQPPIAVNIQTSVQAIPNQTKSLPAIPENAQLKGQNKSKSPSQRRWDAKQRQLQKRDIKRLERELDTLQIQESRYKSAMTEQLSRGNNAKYEKASLARTREAIKVYKTRIRELDSDNAALRRG